MISAGFKLQAMLKTDGPNKVKSLVAGLPHTAEKLDYDRSRYSPWLNGTATILSLATLTILSLMLPPTAQRVQKKFRADGAGRPGISTMSFVRVVVFWRI